LHLLPLKTGREAEILLAGSSKKAFSFFDIAFAAE
jgi:hypothetical protein